MPTTAYDEAQRAYEETFERLRQQTRRCRRCGGSMRAGSLSVLFHRPGRGYTGYKIPFDCTSCHYSFDLESGRALYALAMVLALIFALPCLGGALFAVWHMAHHRVDSSTVIPSVIGGTIGGFFLWGSFRLLRHFLEPTRCPPV